MSSAPQSLKDKYHYLHCIRTHSIYYQTIKKDNVISETQNTGIRKTKEWKNETVIFD